MKNKKKYPEFKMWQTDKLVSEKLSLLSTNSELEIEIASAHHKVTNEA